MAQDRTKIIPIQEASVAALSYVVENMREMDATEIFAMRWSDDPMAVVDACLTMPGIGYLFYYDGVPVAVVGAMFERPGVANVYMFATDLFPKVGKLMTKFIVRVIIPALVETGIHRAHCLALESYSEVHRWLEALGAKRESTLTAYGRDQENFVCFVWLDRERKYVFHGRRQSAA